MAKRGNINRQPSTKITLQEVKPSTINPQTKRKALYVDTKTTLYRYARRKGGTRIYDRQRLTKNPKCSRKKKIDYS